MYGLQFVVVFRKWLKRGIVYVMLGCMEDKGYIVSCLELVLSDVGGLPRCVYEVMVFGCCVLAVWRHMVW